MCLWRFVEWRHKEFVFFFHMQYLNHLLGEDSQNYKIKKSGGHSRPPGCRLWNKGWLALAVCRLLLRAFHSPCGNNRDTVEMYCSCSIILFFFCALLVLRIWLFNHTITYYRLYFQTRWPTQGGKEAWQQSSESPLQLPASCSGMHHLTSLELSLAPSSRLHAHPHRFSRGQPQVHIKQQAVITNWVPAGNIFLVSSNH